MVEWLKEATHNSEVVILTPSPRKLMDIFSHYFAVKLKLCV